MAIRKQISVKTLAADEDSLEVRLDVRSNISVQLETGLTGTVVFECTNGEGSAAEWVSCALVDSSETDGVTHVVSTTAAGVFNSAFPVNARRFRARVDAYTSDSARIVIVHS